MEEYQCFEHSLNTAVDEVPESPLSSTLFGYANRFDSVTEGIYLFLSRPLPRIYFWTEGEGLRMVRDGVHTDLLNSEK